MTIKPDTPGQRYEFNFSTILIPNEWRREYFDKWQDEGWELLNVSPSTVSGVHYCYWRRRIAKERP